MKALTAFNLQRWIGEHRHLLKPPVGNKCLFRDSEFIIMVVGGPNSRKDFHVDPGEEFFFQLEGDMLLRTVQQGRIVDVPIRQGEVLLLPPNVPHSPQRYAHTVGLVVERERRPGELDAFHWYCERCEALLYAEQLQLTDIETQFPPLFERFYGNPANLVCRSCGSRMERPG